MGPNSALAGAHLASVSYSGLHFLIMQFNSEKTQRMLPLPWRCFPLDHLVNLVWLVQV